MYLGNNLPNGDDDFYGLRWEHADCKRLAKPTLLPRRPSRCSRVPPGLITNHSPQMTEQQTSRKCSSQADSYRTPHRRSLDIPRAFIAFVSDAWRVPMDTHGTVCKGSAVGIVSGRRRSYRRDTPFVCFKAEVQIYGGRSNC